MNFDEWTLYYSNPEAPTLLDAFARALRADAVDSRQSFTGWCKAQYKIYRKNPHLYELPDIGLLG
jgi:hypothetical protein